LGGQVEKMERVKREKNALGTEEAVQVTTHEEKRYCLLGPYCHCEFSKAKRGKIAQKVEKAQREGGNQAAQPEHPNRKIGKATWGK